MDEGTYEYECMRAELLGVEKPDYDEFMKKRAETERRSAADEELDTENLKEAVLQEESEKRVLSGLEELNSILQRTQVKINRFKASCGSLTNLLKIKVTGKSDSSSSIDGNSTVAPENVETMRDDDVVSENPRENYDVEKNDENAAQRKSDLSKALDKDLSKLDAMIQKAEDAQYSMQHQRNQMKRFLN